MKRSVNERMKGSRRVGVKEGRTTTTIRTGKKRTGKKRTGKKVMPLSSVSKKKKGRKGKAKGSVRVRRRQKRRRAGRIVNKLTTKAGIRRCRVVATRTNRKLVWTWPKREWSSGANGANGANGGNSGKGGKIVRSTLVGSAGASLGGVSKQRSDRGTDSVANLVRQEAKYGLLREMLMLRESNSKVRDGAGKRPTYKREVRVGAGKRPAYKRARIDVDVLYEGKGKGRVLVRKMRKGRKKRMKKYMNGTIRRLRSVSDRTSEVHNGCSGKKRRRR